MRINVTWDDDSRTTLRYDFEAGWTINDYQEATKVSNAMMAEVSHQVDFIANFEQGHLPDIVNFSNMARSRGTSPDNLGLIVIVGLGEFTRAMVNVFCRLYRRLAEQIVVVGTLAEARNLLAKRRPHSVAE